MNVYIRVCRQQEVIDTVCMALARFQKSLRIHTVVSKARKLLHLPKSLLYSALCPFLVNWRG